MEEYIDSRSGRSNMSWTGATAALSRISSSATDAGSTTRTFASTSTVKMCLAFLAGFALVIFPQILLMPQALRSSSRNPPTASRTLRPVPTRARSVPHAPSRSVLAGRSDPHAPPYNSVESGKKYLLVELLEGLNHQRKSIALALYACLKLGRVCLIPMPHALIPTHEACPVATYKTGPGNNYPSECQREFLAAGAYSIPVDVIFDFRLMSDFVEAVPLNVTTMEFETMHGAPQCNLDVHSCAVNAFFTENDRWGVVYDRLGRVTDWYGAQLDRFATKKFLYLAGTPGHFREAPGDRLFSDARHHVVFRNSLRSFARDIVQDPRIGLPSSFWCLHIRQGDYLTHTPGSEIFDRVVRGNTLFLDPDTGYSAQVEGRKVPMSERSVAYIATEPSTDISRFRKLAAQFSMLLSERDLPAGTMDPLDTYFDFSKPERVRLRNDILGIVEQLMCAHAKHFIGNNASGFTSFIQLLRQNPRMYQPEPPSQT